MKLTDEEKRRLTEFSGKCWHTTDVSYRNGCYCIKCNVYIHKPELFDYDDSIAEKLCSKFEDVSLMKSNLGIWSCTINGMWFGYGETINQSIFVSVLSYLSTNDIHQ